MRGAGPVAEDSDTFSRRETTREGKEKSKEAKTRLENKYRCLE